MTEKEALWHEFEHGVSQQGSSLEGNPLGDIPSARVVSQTGAGPSGRVTEEIDSDDVAEVDSEETHVLATAMATDAESDLESHPGEGMLLKNPRSNVVTEDIRLWRYLYGIPLSVEIRVPTAHERVDWVVPGWVAIYELMLKDGMRFPIPKLLRDVCDHYEIAPSQLMPNAWRVLMSIESLIVRHGVDCELGEVLFSYYLKEHDKDKGRFKLIARVGRAPIVTCLRTNDRGWKDRFIFVRGDLVWGQRGPGGVSGYWKVTSRDFNRALPSGLIAEERTRQLLDIAVGERDYRVSLSEENLRASRLWAFVEERPEAASAAVGKSQSTGSAEPSPGKANKAKGKYTEGGNSIVVPMPSDGSVYSDPSFVKDATEALLLSADRKRLSEIGPVQSAEWSCAHAYQALMGWTHLRSQITAQEKRNVDLTASNATLRKSNEKLAAQLEELKTRNEELSFNNTCLVEQNAKILG
ncbi:hypothetical protein UlMin_030574 [Ulmus minor]